MDLPREFPLAIDVNNHARSILEKLNLMRQEQKNCDVIINVQGKKIHVNRDVMCAASDYFDAMFSHDTKEKQEGVIEMKDVEFSSVEKCIDFVYSGKISVSEDECEKLLYSASLMQLHQICENISPFLEGRLTPNSFFNIRRIAVKFSLEMLNAACDKFALCHLFALAGQKEFNNLDIDFISFLLSSKKSSGHRIEDSKLAVALQWIKAHLDHREKHLMMIVKLLDTSKLTHGYVRFLVENEPLCLKSTEFMKELLIGITIANRVEVSGPPILSKASFPSTLTWLNSLLIFDESSKVVQLYQPSGSKLTQVNEFHSQMDNYFTASVLKEYLYVFNRNKKAFRLNICEEYSAWLQITDMLHDHGYGIQCTVQENCIYVSGENKMERYRNGECENWEDINLNGNVCYHSALVSYEEYVFMIGGRKALIGSTVDSATKFSASSSTWTSVKSMNVARCAASATVFDDKIYVAGGQSQWCTGKLSDFEMYDGVSDSWTILSKMNSPRSLFALCLVNNQIFAIDNKSDKLSIEVYDSMNKKWVRHNDGPEMKIHPAATVAAYIPWK